MFEPKQFELVFPEAVWLYPADFLFAVLTLFYLLTRKRMPKLSREFLGICLAFAVFAGSYLLTSTINLFVEPSVDTRSMINGVGRIVLQYLIDPPIILCTLWYVFGRKRWEALRSLVMPSVLAIAVFLGAIVLVIFANGASIPTTIRQEILTQAWIPLGSFALYIPKWGVTYAESQEFGLFLFLSFLLVDIYRERDSRAHRLEDRALTGLYCVLILWTASKGVLVGACVYLLLRSNRHIQIKSAALIASFVLLGCYLGYGVIHDPVTFRNNALSSTSLDGRIFPVLYFMQNTAAHPLHLLIGFGTRQYGTMISRDYPLDFIKSDTPVSMFGVVTDSGLLGIACYFSMMVSVWLSLRGYRAKLAAIAAFIADLWMPDWSMDIYLLFLLIILFSSNTDCDERTWALPFKYIFQDVSET
jgi:hypothetical protein